MQCSECRKWLCQRVTDYEDGSRIVNHQSPEGKGLCEVLGIETSVDFGCLKFEEGHGHVEVIGIKKGSPWHHSRWGTCPDCGGAGWGCRRCAGTGRVLYYDDGYVGEEQTRRHPNEVKMGSPPKPECMQCSADIDPNWMACPYCGTKIDKPETIRVDDELLTAGNRL